MQPQANEPPDGRYEASRLKFIFVDQAGAISRPSIPAPFLFRLESYGGALTQRWSIGLRDSMPELDAQR
jgi:hypothetical protein